MNNLSNGNKKTNLEFSASNAGNVFSLAVVFLLVFSLFWSILIKVFKIDTDFVYFANYIPAPLAVICALLTLYLRGNKDCFKLLKPTKPSKNAILATVLITLGLVFGVSKINEYFMIYMQVFFDAVTPPTMPNFSPLNLVFAIIFICIIPTITEEILMRKVVLDGLKEVGEVFAVFAGGFIFAIFHMSPLQTIYQFIVGCAFSYIVIKGGNYLVTMVAHLFNNLYIILNYYIFKINIINYCSILEVVIPLLAIGCFIAGIIVLAKNGKKLEENINKEKLIEFLISSAIGIIICISMWVSSMVG
ncbi:MAG: CPBP family intramembrane metalloprotease [Clostridia bacterium]|nr:CPBP family intramembrane metalloprotease [Clostridia bacterium]